jgi:hypothetical protein
VWSGSEHSLGWHSLIITALNKVDAEFHSCERVISKLESSNWQVCLDYRRDARRAANVAWLPVFLVAIVPIPIFWLLGWIVFRFSRWAKISNRAGKGTCTQTFDVLHEATELVA